MLVGSAQTRPNALVPAAWLARGRLPPSLCALRHDVVLNMSADASELDGLAKSFRAIPALMVPKLKGVVAKSALNTKNIMRKDALSSKHFKGVARSISYDLKVHEFGGDGVIEAEVGPTIGGGGSLGSIAYYGSSKPGGGTVRNPEDAMLEEAPNFYEYAFKATEGLL